MIIDCETWNTNIEKGGRTMNEIYEAMSAFLEEIRCDSDEREYAVEIPDMEETEEKLKNQRVEFGCFLSGCTESDRKLVEEYLTITDMAHFKEEQRAYYQGIMDGIQMLGELGLIKMSENVELLLKYLHE